MVWTTNNGIHFFRRPSQLHPSLFLSSRYSSSFARSKCIGAWCNFTRIIFQILFFTAVFIPLGSSFTFNARIDPREWKLPVDKQVGSKLATIYITGGSDTQAISFAVESKPDYHNTGVSSSYDWSSFFKITRRNNGNGIVRLKKSLEGAFKPGQKVEMSIIVEQEGNDFTIRKDVHIIFEPPERDIIEYETDPESETNTTIKPGLIPTVDKPWKEISSQNSEPSQNVTKEPRIENTTNVLDGPMTDKSDTNATIYAGIVIGIIMLIVIALMVYLSRKKLRPWLFTVLYRDKDGAKIEDANGEFGFPSNAHELQKSPSSATGILTLSYTGGPNERKISTSSSIGGNSYASNFANTTISTIADETILEEDSKWEFPRHRLRQNEIKLGEGGFGLVWKFEADNIDGNKGSTTVAVKMLKAHAAESEKRDLLQELAIMKLLEPHPNVVRLLGCCTEKDPIYVILEYVNGGTLQTQLKKSRSEHNYRNLHGESQSLSSRDLTSFAYQIAKGMAYLASKRVIHRDLAARNILIDTNGNNSFSAVDQWKCKIADFGFARDIMANNMYERKTDGRLPIRWMAPETIQDNLYTAKSDVWSFGVLMWEIVTLGSTPYVGMGAKEVIKYVNEGKRLQMPKHCKRELFNIMFYCWNADPSKRPEWSGPDSLQADFEKLLLEDTDYIDLNMYPEHEYYNEVDLSGEKV